MPGTHFHEGLSQPQGHGLVGRKYVTEKSTDTTGNRSRDRPNSSAAPQSLVLGIHQQYKICLLDIMRTSKDTAVFKLHGLKNLLL
jgi:hypothetical protein